MTMSCPCRKLGLAAMLCLASAGVPSLAVAESIDCALTLSAVLDDHYESGGSYEIEVSGADADQKVYFRGTPPLPHGRPFGKVFNNWVAWTIPLPDIPLQDGVVRVELRHSKSARGDWVAFDRLTMRCGSFLEERELAGYSNYGRDGAATILYADRRLALSFQVRTSQPAPPLSVHFVDPSGAAFPDASMIGYGATLAVEARFEGGQEEENRRLRLHFGGSSHAIDLRRLGDGSTYRSEPLILMPLEN